MYTGESVKIMIGLDDEFSPRRRSSLQGGRIVLQGFFSLQDMGLMLSDNPAVAQIRMRCDQGLSPLSDMEGAPWGA